MATYEVSLLPEPSMDTEISIHNRSTPLLSLSAELLDMIASSLTPRPTDFSDDRTNRHLARLAQTSGALYEASSRALTVVILKSENQINRFLRDLHKSKLRRRRMSPFNNLTTIVFDCRCGIKSLTVQHLNNLARMSAQFALATGESYLPNLTRIQIGLNKLDPTLFSRSSPKTLQGFQLQSTLIGFGLSMMDGTIPSERKSILVGSFIRHPELLILSNIQSYCSIDTITVTHEISLGFLHGTDIQSYFGSRYPPDRILYIAAELSNLISTGAQVGREISMRLISEDNALATDLHHSVKISPQDLDGSVHVEPPMLEIEDPGTFRLTWKRPWSRAI